MRCRYCQGDRVVWRRPSDRAAYTRCQDCKRRNCELRGQAFPHGSEECARAQLQLRM